MNKNQSEIKYSIPEYRVRLCRIIRHPLISSGGRESKAALGSSSSPRRHPMQYIVATQYICFQTFLVSICVGYRCPLTRIRLPRLRISCLISAFNFTRNCWAAVSAAFVESWDRGIILPGCMVFAIMQINVYFYILPI